MIDILQHIAAHHLPIVIGGAGTVRTVTLGATTKRIYGRDLGLNGSVAMRIAWDKVATAHVLEGQGVPTLAHRAVTRAPSGDPWELADRQALAEFFRASGADIVCKPARGDRGANVHRVRTPEALARAVSAILQHHRAAALSPFAPFEIEYRCIVLGETAEIVFGKRRVRIAGDGIRSCAGLIDAWGATSPDARARADRVLRAGARAMLDRVPPAGERFLLDWRHNLEHGAVAEWVPPADPVRPALEALAVAASQALGMRFCSVDIAGTPDGPKVVEVNSVVLFEKAARMLPGGEEAAIGLYTKALRLLFDAPA